MNAPAVEFRRGSLRGRDSSCVCCVIFCFRLNQLLRQSLLLLPTICRTVGLKEGCIMAVFQPITEFSDEEPPENKAPTCQFDLFFPSKIPIFFPIQHDGNQADSQNDEVEETPKKKPSAKGPPKAPKKVKAEPDVPEAEAENSEEPVAPSSSAAKAETKKSKQTAKAKAAKAKAKSKAKAKAKAKGKSSPKPKSKAKGSKPQEPDEKSETAPKKPKTGKEAKEGESSFSCGSRPNMFTCFLAKLPGSERKVSGVYYYKKTNIWGVKVDGKEVVKAW